ncbi:thioesterase family protein [Staphylococcus lutrae]|uniref:3-hydroxyacyl-CoA dehydrogenase n=1 Tax=Staphylococcus lutrae TaxID=155085 RepID=A0AAC9RQQ4_9STAP|nr:thioesterase family protein [Staphylococcus lutrae]ARJ50503.1 3-hydroxyacyl-CoA dehydrogenase [Staphylococcus lutrae]PNZ37404.1 3-hydroxyacyl-CoA dehydrogenase [Staphylococcus lutrae]
MLSYPFYDPNVVQADWIDRNGHMNDAVYAKVFSSAIDHFHDQIGLTSAKRDQCAFTVFTLETHLTYLQELKLHTPFKIKVSIYDLDQKRTHFFLQLLHQETDALMATAETMMMGIDQQTRSAAPFPKEIYAQLQHYVQTQGTLEWPKQLGHRIGIPR